MNGDELRALERASIRQFLESNASEFEGRRVLDFGAGRMQYRSIVEDAGGDYHPYDRMVFPASIAHTDCGADRPLAEKWDVIICTQVIQYLLDPKATMYAFRSCLWPHGVLLMTGPTNWPEVEPEDRWRFTVNGVRALLENAMFAQVMVASRATLPIPGFNLSLGWGARATATKGVVA